MSENLRHFFNRSRHLMEAVFTRSPPVGTSNQTEHGATPDSTAQGESARRQDPPETVVMLERIHQRLDSIDQKIDQLFMLMNAVKH